MKKTELLFNVIRLPADISMILAAGLTTYLLRTEILSAFRPVLFEVNLPLAEYTILVLGAAIIFVASYAILGLYSVQSRHSISDEFARVIIGSSAGIMTLIVVIFLRQELFDSRFLILGGWIFSVGFVCGGRFLVRYVQALLRSRYQMGLHRILMIDGDGSGEHIQREILKDPRYGYHITETMRALDLGLIAPIAQSRRIDEVIVAGFDQRHEDVPVLIDLCHHHHVAVRFVPTVYSGRMSNSVEVDIMNGIPLIEFKRTRLDGWGRVVKRSIDIVASIFGVVVCVPLICIVAFAIKWESEGSVFVRLKRISGTQQFGLYKFRSMVVNAEELKPYLRTLNERQDGPLFKISDDPRITKIGKFIRRFRIDEIPQFINILMGHMSLVGPRPHQPDEIARYAHHQKKVLTIKAGATGLAQASGSSSLTFEEEVALDSFYIDNWSLVLDLKIILKTVMKIVSDRSAV